MKGNVWRSQERRQGERGKREEARGERGVSARRARGDRGRSEGERPSIPSIPDFITCFSEIYTELPLTKIHEGRRGYTYIYIYIYGVPDPAEPFRHSYRF